MNDHKQVSDIECLNFTVVIGSGLNFNTSSDLVPKIVITRSLTEIIVSGFSVFRTVPGRETEGSSLT